ncbi:hypothetical protein CC78DRAFT_566852 [Lojkania enalia]|uniref:Mid2 domain-containing protein n=1 Tax=Lojkania enalia TaxID=147567 RepID=A0A9P4N1U1_9PLEO|nr:hypothetical protein CC78DRAFT_566852 [Didymosphaeria enalia]
MLGHLSRVVVAILIPYTLCADLCYYPNGTQNAQVPCDSNAPASHCCDLANQCLSNGMCAIRVSSETGVEYGRGSCTDSSWEDPVCPPECRLNHDTPNNSSVYDFRAGEVKIWECGVQGHARDAEYCCESEAEGQRCCYTTEVLFSMPSASLGPFTGLPESWSAAVTLPTGESTVPTSVTLIISAGGGESAVSTPSPTASSITNEGIGNDDDNKGTIIGGAVGGSIGGIAIIVAVVFLLRIRRRAGRKGTHNMMPQEMLPESNYQDHKVGRALYQLQPTPVELVGDASLQSPRELQGGV